MTLFNTPSFDQGSLSTHNPILTPPQQVMDWESKTELSTQKMIRNKRKLSFSASANRDQWTEQEELDMLLAHKQYKNKWSEITKHLKGKSNNTIKNRFYSIFRRIRGKVQRENFIFESKLELLKICYMTSLMVYHLDHPMSSSRVKEGRGKDFIYSLIHNLPREKVKKYEEKIKELVGHRGSMNDLINKLVVTSDADTPSATPETKLKDISFEYCALPENSNIPPQFQVCDFLEEPFILPNLESSMLGDSDSSSPDIPQSPSTLSEGPAAAAANASRAACFTNASDEWDDFGSMEKISATRKLF